MFYEMVGYCADPSQSCSPDLPEVDVESAALFLDFDGTLIELADTPDSIEVPDRLGPDLMRLRELLGGRLAIVTGRPVADIERFLPDWTGVVIGSHGAERRIDGKLSSHERAGTETIEHLQGIVRAYAKSVEGFLAEDKPVGAVLHYRNASDRQAEAYRFIEGLLPSFPGLELHRSKGAFEVRPDDVGKGQALEALMKLEPFAGATPIMIGDDMTDEPAFIVAQKAGGIGIKVGTEDTNAAHRVQSVDEVHHFLGTFADDTAEEEAA